MYVVRLPRPKIATQLRVSSFSFLVAILKTIFAVVDIVLQWDKAFKMRVHGYCFPFPPSERVAGMSHSVRSPLSSADFSDSWYVATYSLLRSKLAAKESRLRTSTSNEAHSRGFALSTSSPYGKPQTWNVSLLNSLLLPGIREGSIFLPLYDQV